MHTQLSAGCDGILALENFFSSVKGKLFKVAIVMCLFHFNGDREGKFLADIRRVLLSTVVN